MQPWGGTIPYRGIEKKILERRKGEKETVTAGMVRLEPCRAPSG
jgi:hypothetical protein